MAVAQSKNQEAFSGGSATSGSNIIDARYELLEIIGRGAASVVYRARRLDSSTEKDFIALKIFLDKSKDRQEKVLRAKREGLALLVCRHPHVVKLFDFVARAELSYLSMEYCARGDLQALKERLKTPVAIELAVELMTQLLQALSLLHNLGVLHRDIKPENLLLTSDMRLKLTDFGLAQLPLKPVEKEDALLAAGTLEYLSPEVLEGKSADHRADLYAVAVVLYQLLTGNLPFSGTSISQSLAEKMRGIPRTIESKILDTLPDNFVAFISKALASRPADRFQSATEFETALKLLLDGEWVPEVTKLPEETKSDERVFPLTGREGELIVSERGHSSEEDELSALLVEEEETGIFALVKELWESYWPVLVGGLFVFTLLCVMYYMVLLLSPSRQAANKDTYVKASLFEDVGGTEPIPPPKAPEPPVYEERAPLEKTQINPAKVVGAPVAIKFNHKVNLNFAPGLPALMQVSNLDPAITHVQAIIKVDQRVLSVPLKERKDLAVYEGKFPTPTEKLSYSFMLYYDSEKLVPTEEFKVERGFCRPTLRIDLSKDLARAKLLRDAINLDRKIWQLAYVVKALSGEPELPPTMSCDKNPRILAQQELGKMNEAKLKDLVVVREKKYQLLLERVRAQLTPEAVAQLRRLEKAKGLKYDTALSTEMELDMLLWRLVALFSS